MDKQILFLQIYFCVIQWCGHKRRWQGRLRSENNMENNNIQTWISEIKTQINTELLHYIWYCFCSFLHQQRHKEFTPTAFLSVLELRFRYPAETQTHLGMFVVAAVKSGKISAFYKQKMSLQSVAVWTCSSRTTCYVYRQSFTVEEHADWWLTN